MTSAGQEQKRLLFVSFSSYSSSSRLCFLSLSSEFYYKFDLALFIYSMIAPMCTYIDRNPLFLFSFLPPFHQLLVVCTLIFVQMDEGTKRETTVARSKSLCDEWRSNARHKVHSLAYAGTKERKKRKIHDETLMSVLVFFHEFVILERAYRSSMEDGWFLDLIEATAGGGIRSQRRWAQLSFALRWARRNNFVFYRCGMFSLTSKRSSR